MKFPRRSFLLMTALLVFNGNAFASDTNCTLIVDFKTSEIIHEDGDCKSRHGAQSTFKLPLALMGFDSGILKDETTPEWNYDPSYETNREAERHATNPTRWEKESIVWFSQKLTKEMGPEKFKTYVESFQYGNMDIAGDAGKNNGLTHSWLSSSLQISPVEQIAFIRGLLNRTLNVSDHAYEMTVNITPEFTAEDWIVHGKTGTGFRRKNNGHLDRTLQRGWFVGWAEKDNQKIIFAKFIADTKKEKTYGGPRARDAFLKEFPAIIQHHNRTSQH